MERLTLVTVGSCKYILVLLEQFLDPDKDSSKLNYCSSTLNHLSVKGGIRN